jgi:hypothetical protein
MSAAATIAAFAVFFPAARGDTSEATFEHLGRVAVRF